MVHAGGPGATWNYLRMPLLEDQLTMIYLEPVGTGASDRLAEHPMGYSVERYSEQLRGFLVALGLRDVHLLGHSHGGFVVQHCALSDPDRIAGLILYDTSAVTGPGFLEQADANVRSFAARHRGDERAEAVLKAWEAVPSISDDASYTQTMRALLPAYFADPYSPSLPLAAMQEEMHFTFVVGDRLPFDVRDALADLDLPTLVIVGEADFICGPYWARTLTTAIPNSDLLFLSECGHLAHVEKAEVFAGAVISFVQRNSR